MWRGTGTRDVAGASDVTEAGTGTWHGACNVALGVAGARDVAEAGSGAWHGARDVAAARASDVARDAAGRSRLPNSRTCEGPGSETLL